MLKRLLIADDSELVRTSLLGLLADIAGIDATYTADSLAQTLDRVLRVSPTLAILDLHLRDGNAIQILGTIKHLAPRIQIAVLTNDASDFNRTKCVQAGADWFFDKSTEFERVVEIVHLHARALH